MAVLLDGRSDVGNCRINYYTLELGGRVFGTIPDYTACRRATDAELLTARLDGVDLF